MKRRLSAPEAFTWAGGEIPRNFALTARLRGIITADQLRPAVARARHKYPQIAGRIVLEADGPWYETDDVPDPPVRTTEDTWEDVLAGELTMRFPSVAGPLVRFVIVSDAEYTDLVLVCHHCIADGLSAAYILRDLLQYMGEPSRAAEPLAELPPFAEMLPPMESSRMPLPALWPAQAAAVPTSDGDLGGLCVLRWPLARDQTSHLVGRCHQERTTVHAALCTAFLLAAGYLGQPAASFTHVVSTPVNVRGRLCPPVGEQVGFFIHPGVKTSLRCTPGEQFWDMTREVKLSLCGAIHDAGLFGMFYVAQALLTLLPFEEACRVSELPVDYDLSLSNLGRLDLQTAYRSFSLEALYGPATNGLQGETIVGVVTAAATLTFTLVTHDRIMDRATAEGLREVAMERLAEAVVW